MHTTATFLPYHQTGFFSAFVSDYISQNHDLSPFYKHPATLDGLKTAMAERKSAVNHRQLLVDVLNEQYKNEQLSPKQTWHLEQLKSDTTFTICTAHQPNIFTGPLYFIYKIVHAIKLAEELKAAFPENDFVPFYYMGSEDADLDELGHIYIKGEKFEWATKQTGAVGRMTVDDQLLSLINTIGGQLLVYPHGAEIIGLMKQAYTKGITIEAATFKLVNQLFAEHGLMIVLPDNAQLKSAYIPVMEKELLEGFSHGLVEQTVSSFPDKYKVQASGRDINLFYLSEGKRERIEKVNDNWEVLNTDLKFSKEAILQELHDHPERFSPNVILRPGFQETILPNIAFIGGGGELAYWLELKKVFEAVQIPYPVLIVRNSFMFISKELQSLMDKLQFDETIIFKSSLELTNTIVKRDSALQLNLEKEKQQFNQLYELVKNIAGKIDVTLQPHTEALQSQAMKKIHALELKMMRSEKKKFDAEQRQITKLKMQLFPNNNLQERISNLMPFYANWGKGFIDMIVEQSHGLTQTFGILKEK